MTFLSDGIEVGPLLPLEGEFRVEAGGELLGWLSVVTCLPLTCLTLYSFAEELRRRYLLHDLHFNSALVFAGLFSVGLAVLTFLGVQRVRAAHLPIVRLLPGELRLCNSLAPIALKDIQAIEHMFFRNSAIVTLVVKPEAALPSLAPHQFGMPDGRRVWRKHRIIFQLLQPMYAGQSVTKISVIRRIEQYWIAANT